MRHLRSSISIVCISLVSSTGFRHTTPARRSVFRPSLDNPGEFAWSVERPSCFGARDQLRAFGGAVRPDCPDAARPVGFDLTYLAGELLSRPCRVAILICDLKRISGARTAVWTGPSRGSRLPENDRLQGGCCRASGEPGQIDGHAACSQDGRGARPGGSRDARDTTRFARASSRVEVPNVETFDWR